MITFGSLMLFAFAMSQIPTPVAALIEARESPDLMVTVLAPADGEVDVEFDAVGWSGCVA